MKALVITVGTGVGQSKKPKESLSNALAFTIKHHNPDATYFITSPDSETTTLPRVFYKTKIKKYEIITLQNPDNIEKIYERLQPIFMKIRQDYDQITVDYTSGTKAMAAASAVLGAIYEADTFSYITGKRRGGIVQAGTEEICIIQPYFAIAEQKAKTAVQFFNRNQFNATIAIINQIKKATTDHQITDRLTPLNNLAKAYEAWDKFDHQKAFSIIKKIKLQEINRNKRFLGQLLKAKQPEPYYTADLINNAERRGGDEKKYDDATARLYRTIELVAQHQLKTKYNIQTSAVKPTDIPEELKKKWDLDTPTTTLKIGLEKAYQLLVAKNDPIGAKFTNDNKLKDLLNKRNTSILAHNLRPVTKQTYRELHKKILEYAKLTITNLDKLLQDSAFIKWKDCSPSSKTMFIS